MRTEEMQKITVEVPKRLLTSLKRGTKKGNTEIIRDALKEMASRRAQRELADMRGTLKYDGLTVEEMRSWEDK